MACVDFRKTLLAGSLGKGEEMMKWWGGKRAREGERERKRGRERKRERERERERERQKIKTKKKDNTVLSLI